MNTRPNTCDIRPRWEWRAFSRGFGRAEARLKQLEPYAVQSSEEIYLLSASDGSVKLRDGTIEVKDCQVTRADGLERWIPTLKVPFPLSSSDVEAVFTALGLSTGSGIPSEVSEAQFCDWLAHKPRAVDAVEVRKHRRRYKIEDCLAELAEIDACDTHTLTIAVESEDPETVVDAVACLGLSGLINTSYPKGLAALLRRDPERYAVIDIGTNSVKFNISERDLCGRWISLVDRSDMTRLGEGMSATHALQPPAITRTADAVSKMAAEAKATGVMGCIATGTAALRLASNATEALVCIRDRCGQTVEVISGEEESRLAFLATSASLGLSSGSIMVFDTGGGSSQFTYGHGLIVEERFSLNIGAVMLTERFGLHRVVSALVVKEALQFTALELSKLDNRRTPDLLVGMGGAVTNMAAVMHGQQSYDPSVIQGTRLTRDEVDRQIELYRSSDSDQRNFIPGLQPKRADVILAGACIVRAILEKSGRDNLVVSTRGLRHGLLIDRLGEQKIAIAAETPNACRTGTQKGS